MYIYRIQAQSSSGWKYYEGRSRVADIRWYIRRSKDIFFKLPTSQHCLLWKAGVDACEDQVALTLGPGKSPVNSTYYSLDRLEEWAIPWLDEQVANLPVKSIRKTSRFSWMSFISSFSRWQQTATREDYLAAKEELPALINDLKREFPELNVNDPTVHPK